ncbi:MAG: hypothetical protein LBG65_07865 [Puniceicoccales bacterium]|nr:hypothetical protein [Puniceicoccales bacterium]
MKTTTAIATLLALSIVPSFAEETDPKPAKKAPVENAPLAYRVSLKPKTLLNIPGLRQNLRPFQSISFDLVREEKKSDGTWHPILKRRVRLDYKNKRIYQYEIEKSGRGDSIFLHRERVQFDKRVVEMEFKTGSDDFSPSQASARHDASVQIFDIPTGLRIRDTSELMCFYYADHSMGGEDNDYQGWFLDLFSRSKSGKRMVSEDGDEKSDEIIVYYGTDYLGIDTRKGIVTKKLQHYADGTGNLRKPKLEHEATKFFPKDGWNFPVEIISHSREGRETRERVDADSLGVNTEFTTADFAFNIPSGTRVRDLINDVSFVADEGIARDGIGYLEKKVSEKMKENGGLPARRWSGWCGTGLKNGYLTLDHKKIQELPVGTHAWLYTGVSEVRGKGAPDAIKNPDITWLPQCGTPIDIPNPNSILVVEWDGFEKRWTHRGTNTLTPMIRCKHWPECAVETANSAFPADPPIFDSDAWKKFSEMNSKTALSPDETQARADSLESFPAALDFLQFGEIIPLHEKLKRVTREEVLAIPGVQKNLQPIHSLSLRILSEEKRADGSWAPLGQERFQYDSRRKLFLHDALRIKETESTLTLRGEKWDKDGDYIRNKTVRVGRKALGISFSTRETRLAPIETLTKKNPNGYLTVGQFPYDSAPIEVLSTLCFLKMPEGDWNGDYENRFDLGFLFNTASSPDTFVLKQNEENGDVYAIREDFVLVIDTKRGVVTRSMEPFCGEDGKMSLHPSIKVTKFVQKDGFLFPAEIVFFEEGKPVLRHRIDPDSIEINRDFPISDLMLKIPAGMTVQDNVRGRTFVTKKDLTLDDVPGDSKRVVKLREGDEG